MPYLGARPARWGFVHYLPFHNVNAPRDALSEGECRRPRATAVAVQLAAPQPAQILLWMLETHVPHNVPKLGADPPNLLDNGQAPELPSAAPSPDTAMTLGSSRSSTGHARAARPGAV